MLASSYFYLVPFLFFGSTLQTDNSYLHKYVPLIIGLHELYGPSRVCIVLPLSVHNTTGSAVAVTLTRDFSRRGVQTFIIDTEESLKRTDNYNAPGVRPLVVVVLAAAKDVAEFVGNKRKFEVLHPVWLLIFTEEFGTSICEHCNNPTKNIFGLRFDTEMLIICCENKSLQEWWSDHRNGTERNTIGEWSIGDGLTSITNQSLYARRSEVNGVGFRIGVVTNSAFYLEEDGRPGGFFNSILRELEQVMDFKEMKITKKEGFGSWDSEAQSWSGVIELLDANEADLGVAEFSMTTHRLQVVDFTLPLMVTPIQVYFRALDSSEVEWSAHFKAFALQIWMTIVLLVITSSILVAGMKMRTGSHSFPHLISEHYLYVWGIFCQQGLAVFPPETPLRIAYCSIFISALVVSAAYSAALISFITVSTTSFPFTTLEEFVNDGTYDLVVLKNSADWDLFDSSPDPVYSKMKTLLRPWESLPNNMQEGFEQICDGRTAFYSSQALVKTGMNHLPCKISHIDTGSIDSFALILRKGSEYTGVMNYHIQRFEDNGMLNRLKRKYLMKPTEPEATHNEVTIWGVAPILSVLAGGVILSLIILVGEKCYSTLGKSERKWRTSKPNGMSSPRQLTIRRGFDKNKENAALHLQTSLKLRSRYFSHLPMEYRP
ncbi:glutamate receptor ionotropic, kainate 2-like isoform X2 [Venturia canescens]|uniref:glutamate receptor ionotropic, kainate 2-like isoform X2 n=1 Tax=Venturia canescens TaxID=32260 RepID=UPI001C9CBD7B|nr:glutamate receptor ionotropic, kainate 2-like isoform X2 [Venturia canescens]